MSYNNHRARLVHPKVANYVVAIITLSVSTSLVLRSVDAAAARVTFYEHYDKEGKGEVKVKHHAVTLLNSGLLCLKVQVTNCVELSSVLAFLAGGKKPFPQSTPTVPASSCLRILIVLGSTSGSALEQPLMCRILSEFDSMTSLPPSNRVKSRRSVSLQNSSSKLWHPYAQFLIFLSTTLPVIPGRYAIQNADDKKVPHLIETKFLEF